jgi:hypothetical protein
LSHFTSLFIALISPHLLVGILQSGRASFLYYIFILGCMHKFILYSVNYNPLLLFYFNGWVVPELASETPFHLDPVSCWYGSVTCYSISLLSGTHTKVFLAHLVLSLLQPWKQSFLLGALFLLEERILETRIWMLGLLLLECYLADRASKHTCIHNRAASISFFSCMKIQIYLKLSVFVQILPTSYSIRVPLVLSVIVLTPWHLETVVPFWVEGFFVACKWRAD